MKMSSENIKNFIVFIFPILFSFIYVKISIHVKDDSSQPLTQVKKWKRPVKISRRFTISKITKYSFGPIKVESLNTPISEVCNITTMKFSLKNIRKQKIPHNWNLTLDRKKFLYTKLNIYQWRPKGIALTKTILIIDQYSQIYITNKWKR